MRPRIARAPHARRPPRGGVDRNKPSTRTLGDPPVAPHAGAWIETVRKPSRGDLDWLSPPTRGRGSKLRQRQAEVPAEDVAPHAGAWIETRPRSPASETRSVAPHAGAWIETPESGNCDKAAWCRPPRGGVDRNRFRRRHPAGPHVAPHAGAWIETRSHRNEPADRLTSPPTRGRGSKPRRAYPGCVSPSLSPPTRGRGSKPGGMMAFKTVTEVAPHAGAWIETNHAALSQSPDSSPPTRGRGSKQRLDRRQRQKHGSPPTRGRGSKLAIGQATGPFVRSPPTRGRGSKPCGPF